MVHSDTAVSRPDADLQGLEGRACGGGALADKAAAAEAADDLADGDGAEPARRFQERDKAAATEERAHLFRVAGVVSDLLKQSSPR